ncbi:MAG: hypothetical protein AAFO93_05720 [Pseudomonadota bacterium]
MEGAIDVCPDTDATVETPHDPDTPETETTTRSESTVHTCQTCGGAVIFVGQALSERCAYCDGPVVVGQADTGFDALGLIPFQITESAARAQIADWAKARVAAPGNLADAVARGRIVGLYAPFFTFDSHEAVSFWATFRQQMGKRSITRRYEGDMDIRFDDLLVPASPHITPILRDGVLHDFDPKTLTPYQPAFLAGFAAERHHLTVDEGLKANASDKDLLIRNRIQRSTSKRLRNIKYRTTTSGIHYRRILLPMWIVHYEHGGKAYKAVSCGMRGTTFGERPFAVAKLVAYSAWISALALGVGVVWSVLGLP